MMARASTPGWDTIRAFLLAHPEFVRVDAELLDQLGLRINAANVVEFGPAALARHAAAREREQSVRLQMEQTARDNFAAQAQTHAAVVELLEARNNADLARRIDELSQQRFGLMGGVIALEDPGPTPAGWRCLPEGLTDGIFGPEGTAWMGQTPYLADIFGARAHEIGSCALVRLSLWAEGRQGVLAFASAEAEGFTADMGAELVGFLARVVERTAERWPVL
jgi:uncharacterized protein YigA (DUF484 family)